MDSIHSVTGMVTVEVTSADTAAFLTLLAQNQIAVFRVQQVDSLCLNLSLLKNDYPHVCKLCERRGEQIKIKTRTGAYWLFKSILHRFVLLTGIAVVVLLSIFLPTRILFFEVSGNSITPANKILETAQLCGIKFGASRTEIRSEQMKNKLLASMPQLQWAGINTYGCRAVISVSEKHTKPQKESQNGVCSIVASTDGIIESCTATKGNLLCAKGQAVKRGEVLISGYTDCGIMIRASRAEGEIFANTIRNLTVIVPTKYTVKTDNQLFGKNISLILGKKRINLWKNSGIPTTKCVKINKEYVITLPGEYQIPITLAIEEWNGYNTEEIHTASTDVSLDASAAALEYLNTLMISGRVISKSESIENQNQFLILTGQYACHEMIGREQNEEIIHGKDH